jgi:hypothetical protein
MSEVQSTWNIRRVPVYDYMLQSFTFHTCPSTYLWTTWPAESSVRQSVWRPSGLIYLVWFSAFGSGLKCPE